MSDARHPGAAADAGPDVAATAGSGRIRRRGVRALVGGALLLLTGILVNRLWHHVLAVNILHTVGTFAMLYGYYIVFVRRARRHGTSADGPSHQELTQD